MVEEELFFHSLFVTIKVKLYANKNITTTTILFNCATCYNVRGVNIGLGIQKRIL